MLAPIVHSCCSIDYTRMLASFQAVIGHARPKTSRSCTYRHAPEPRGDPYGKRIRAVGQTIYPRPQQMPPLRWASRRHSGK